MKTNGTVWEPPRQRIAADLSRTRRPRMTVHRATKCWPCAGSISRRA